MTIGTLRLPGHDRGLVHPSRPIVQTDVTPNVTLVKRDPDQG